MKRKAERIDFSGEAKIRILSEAKEFSVTVKDISISGIRIIIAGRIVEVNTPIEIKMCINDRHIRCNGKIAWALPLRPAFGDLILFDAGIELADVTAEDAAFLKRLCGGQ